jgi:hypothetical protein
MSKQNQVNSASSNCDSAARIQTTAADSVCDHALPSQSFPPLRSIFKSWQIIRGSDLASDFPASDISEINRLYSRFLAKPQAETAWGSGERTQAWFERNRDCCVFLSEQSRFVGYFAGLPLKQRAFDLVSQQKISPADIEANDIDMFTLPSGFSLFLANISILPRQPHKTFLMLSRAVLNLYVELADSGYFITEIAANALNYLGMELCEDMGMKLRCSSEEHGEAYYLDLTRVSVDELPKNSFLKKLLSAYEQREDWSLFKRTKNP